MPSTSCVQELRAAWLPHLTDGALERLIELLDQESPLLIAGCFEKALPMGCLATHAAWHHPQTAHLDYDAGIAWLACVAGLNPATSHVIREWDRVGPRDWALRHTLLTELRAEQAARRAESPVPELAGV
jgi:hypothetical protein